MSEQVPLAYLLDPSRDPHTVVAYERGQPVRLKELDHRARAWHAAFAQAPGHRYVLHSLSALDFVAALLGAWHAGKRALVPSDLQVTSIAASGMAIDGFVGGRGIQPSSPTPGALPALDPEALCLEMYTSGSTGAPTAIPKCLRQLEHEVAGLSAALDLGPPGRVLGTVSHQHMYGLIFRVLLPLATGRPFEAIRLNQVQDLSLVGTDEGCILISSPAQLVRLPEPGSLSCKVTALLAAGGPLSEEGVRACDALFGVAVTEIYGSSETGAVAWRPRTPGSAGTWRPLPGVSFRSEEGVLMIRTPQLPTREWFQSADRVKETQDGFELAGRIDRIVKLEEKRVSLDALERILMESGFLQRVRALVLDGRRPLLAVAATPNTAGWTVAQDGKRVLVERLREHLQRSGQIEVLPRSWRFIDPWPLTSDGKTPESLLRERFDRRNPEFRVLEQDEASCVLELWVSPTAPFFPGHFPGHPILPGVVQIDWLIWLTRTVLRHSAPFTGLEAAKFRRVILPESRVTVSLKNDARGQRTTYQILYGAQICASGRLCWGIP